MAVKHSSMAVDVLKLRLSNLIQRMYNEEKLDHQFGQLQGMQDPKFFAEIISLFCQSTKSVIKELSKYLDEPVDLNKVYDYVHKLKGSSLSIGAKQIQLACVDLKQACDNNNKEGCIQALDRIKHEYGYLQPQLETIVELEQRILVMVPICKGN